MVRESIKTTAMRIDKDLYKLLAKAAAEDGRSVNQQVVFYIRQALAARKAS